LRIVVLCILLASFFSSAIGIVVGQSASSIELLGFAWARRDVPVYLSGDVQEAQKDAVLTAVRIWVASQVWFSDAYMQGEGYPFYLYLADSPSKNAISIAFTVNASKTVGGITYPDVRDGFADHISIYINIHKTSIQAEYSYVLSVLVHELGHALGLGHSTTKDDVMYRSYDAQASKTFLPSTLDLYALFHLAENKTDVSIQLPASIQFTTPPWFKQGKLIIESSYGATRYAFRYSYDNVASAGGSLHLRSRIENIGNKPVKVVNATIMCDWNPESLLMSTNATDVVQPGSNLTFAWQVHVPSNLGVGNHTVTFKTWIAPLLPDGWLLDMPGLSEHEAMVLVEQAVPVAHTVTTASMAPSTTQGGWHYIVGVAVVAAIVLLAWHLGSTERRGRVEFGHQLRSRVHREEQQKSSTSTKARSGN
jgi:hypothetical protein